jgi:hypothetical protein
MLEQRHSTQGGIPFVTGGGFTVAAADSDFGFGAGFEVTFGGPFLVRRSF